MATQNSFFLQYPVMFGGATKMDQKAVSDMVEGIEYLEGFLGKSKYAAGDHLTLADIVLMASAVTMQVLV